MNKIKQGDTVAVLAGRDKGGRGVVQKVILAADGKPARVVVEGVNMVTCYVRPNPQKNEPGGIVKREASIDASNVAPVDGESGLPARVKIKQGDGGKKERDFYVSARRRAQAQAAAPEAGRNE